MPGKGTYFETMANYERSLIERELTKQAGNLSAVARSLGIARPTLSDKLRALGLRRWIHEAPGRPSGSHELPRVRYQLRYVQGDGTAGAAVPVRVGELHKFMLLLQRGGARLEMYQVPKES